MDEIVMRGMSGDVGEDEGGAESPGRTNAVIVGVDFDNCGAGSE